MKGISLKNKTNEFKQFIKKYKDDVQCTKNAKPHDFLKIIYERKEQILNNESENDFMKREMMHYAQIEREKQMTFGEKEANEQEMNQMKRKMYYDKKIQKEKFIDNYYENKFKEEIKNENPKKESLFIKKKEFVPLPELFPGAEQKLILQNKNDLKEDKKGKNKKKEDINSKKENKEKEKIMKVEDKKEKVIKTEDKKVEDKKENLKEEHKIKEISNEKKTGSKTRNENKTKTDLPVHKNQIDIIKEDSQEDKVFLTIESKKSINKDSPRAGSPNKVNLIKRNSSSLIGHLSNIQQNMENMNQDLAKMKEEQNLKK